MPLLGSRVIARYVLGPVLVKFATAEGSVTAMSAALLERMPNFCAICCTVHCASTRATIISRSRVLSSFSAAR